MKVSPKLVKLLYSFTLIMASVAANTTCHSRYYQEKMDPQLDSLKKYHDE